MAGVVHGNLSHMASVVQQYMRVQAEPMLVGGWLEATPLGSADSAELVTLLAAALAMCFADKADILKPVLLSFRRLAKAIPNLVRSAHMNAYPLVILRYFINRRLLFFLFSSTCKIPFLIPSQSWCC